MNVDEHNIECAERENPHIPPQPKVGDAVSTGTTIVAAMFDGGVVLGADSRVTTGTVRRARASEQARARERARERMYARSVL